MIIGVLKILRSVHIERCKRYHQANKLIVDRLVRKLKLPVEKVPYNLQKFGNMGGASILMLMASEIAEELSSRLLTLLCSSFGLGLTWRTMVLKTNKIKVVSINKL